MSIYQTAESLRQKKLNEADEMNYILNERDKVEKKVIF